MARHPHTGAVAAKTRSDNLPLVVICLHESEAVIAAEGA